MKELKTKRLRVVPLTDGELMEKMACEADEHLRSAYCEMLTGAEKNPESRLWYTAWRIVLKETGESVGDLCFKGPPVNGEVEIGYGIDGAYEGRGYATEAARAAIDWAFSQESAYFIMAESEPGNAASLRVLEKLGFKPWGQGREGPRFQLERPASSWMSIYMCLGMSLGLAIGSSMDSMGAGLSLGMCAGVALGLALDSADKKRRAALNAARGVKDTEPEE